MHQGHKMTAKEALMKLHIEDMHCGGCARSVKAAILAIDSKARIDADPPSRTVTLETSATPEEVRNALTEAGFPPTGV